MYNDCVDELEACHIIPVAINKDYICTHSILQLA